MDETHCIPYSETGFFSDLILDYLNQAPHLQKLYSEFPNSQGYARHLGNRSYPEYRRRILSEALQNQYAEAGINDAALNKVLENIKLLNETSTFTVTTGHQLNLFTGPLYFIYKIITTINTAKRLTAENPGKKVVPVFWMASEDHDFEEINHINLYGGRLRWERSSGGKVGQLSLDGIEPLIDELAQHLGKGAKAREWVEKLRSAYLSSDNLAQATMKLAHSLFGEDGLVILDADRPELKKEFIPQLEDELLTQISMELVEPTTEFLEEHYFKQVHPREINLFYTMEGVRERIVKEEDRWYVLNQEISWNEEQLLEELQTHPGRFSPNVVLRPLYQEVLLPNLGYVGGGGELAYWLQLKNIFDHFRVPFPVLHLRNSVMLVTGKQKRKRDKLGLVWKELFTPLPALEKHFVEKNSFLDTELSDYEQKLSKIFDELEDVAQATEKGMLGAVNAQRQKQLNGLEKLRKKLIRSEKKRMSDQMDALRNLHQDLFPGGGLQERHDNLTAYYTGYGYSLIEHLKEVLNPFDFCFAVVEPESEE